MFHVCHFLRRYIRCIHSLFVSIQLRKQNFLPPKLCFCCYLKLLSVSYIVYSTIKTYNMTIVIVKLYILLVRIKCISENLVPSASLPLPLLCPFHLILYLKISWNKNVYFIFLVGYVHAFSWKNLKFNRKKNLINSNIKFNIHLVFFLSFSSLFSKRLSIIHTHFLVALTLNLAYFGVVKKTISKFMEHNFSQYSHNLSQAHF